MDEPMIVPDSRCQSLQCAERDALRAAVMELRRALDAERTERVRLIHEAHLEIARLNDLVARIRDAAGH